MSDKPLYYLICADVVPEILLRVLDAKGMVLSGRAKSVNEATDALNLSRSAYYKYKDKVFAFRESVARIVTLLAVVDDRQGVLSELLGEIAKSGANVLTINQNIPIDAVANITISLETSGMTVNVEQLLENMQHVSGVCGTIRMIGGNAASS